MASERKKREREAVDAREYIQRARIALDHDFGTVEERASRAEDWAYEAERAAARFADHVRKEAAKLRRG